MIYPCTSLVFKNSSALNLWSK